MSKINNVKLIGKLYKDVEPKCGASGWWQCRFSLGVLKSGKNQDKPMMFIPVKVMTKDAEKVEKLRKGVMIELEGELQVDEYTDKNGQQQKWTGVVAFDLTITDWSPKQTENIDLDLNDLPF
jgi:single-strand DNA-binding protein